jgi:hypothetical protein
LHSEPATARGYVFVAPKAGPAVTTPQGPEIVDDQGRPVWFHALPPGDQAADFRVQHYRGEPVLTWTQGQGLGGVPITPTVDYIVDRSYRVIATVRAGNGLNADQHEFKLTRHGTALIVVYNPIQPDTRPTATAQSSADGTTTVHAIWNGATKVARWIVVGGKRGRALWPIAFTDGNGFDTAVTVSGHPRLVAVVAQDAEGHFIGRSESVVRL